MTIWRFEGGPWDGQQMELHDYLMAPMFQLITPLDGETVRYELAAKEDPATLIYRIERTP